MSIYEEMKAAGVEIDSHESDLYAKVCDKSREIVSRYKSKENVTQFKSLIDGVMWFDIPFAFDPFWQAVQKKVDAARARDAAKKRG